MRVITIRIVTGNLTITGRRLAAALVTASLAACTTACSASSSGSPPGVIIAVGAENEYANVISQIGGKYVHAEAIMSNPNTDPHTFEASPSVAAEVNAAQLIVQNGVDYDTFMNSIEGASPNGSRKVIVVQNLLGLPTDTPNPHLWYNPTTMPAVAKAIASDLSALQPSHAAYFTTNRQRFDQSLAPWLADIAHLKATYPEAPVATTEPVADYMLTAIGADNKTPFAFQADIMNGVDPAPQDVALEDTLLSQHEVRAFVYNQQVVDPLTESLLSLAKQHDVPVVGVYETMPTPGFDYQSWMEAEVEALQKALADKVSTQRL